MSAESQKQISFERSVADQTSQIESPADSYSKHKEALRITEDANNRLVAVESKLYGSLLPGADIESLSDEHDTARSEQDDARRYRNLVIQAGKSHFKQNEAEYKKAALEDAAKDGVHINYP